MLILIAILLGLVEGATEFLPVSSTGHLIIASNLAGFTGAKADTFNVFIQLGAMLAVLVVYFSKFTGLLNLRRTDGFHGRRGLELLALTMLPAVVAGLLLHEFIKQQLFNPVVVAISLIAGGIIIIWFERLHKKTPTRSLDTITRKQALTIGGLQVLSLIPGVSRAGSTILGGMFAGLNRETSVQYSFLAAVPIISGAGLYDLYKSREHLYASDTALFATGFIAAFVFALIAIKLLMRYVKTNDFQPFGWYRIGLGALVLAYFGWFA